MIETNKHYPGLSGDYGIVAGDGSVHARLAERSVEWRRTFPR